MGQCQPVPHATIHYLHTINVYTNSNNFHLYADHNRHHYLYANHNTVRYRHNGSYHHRHNYVLANYDRHDYLHSYYNEAIVVIWYVTIHVVIVQFYINIWAFFFE